MTKTLQRFIFKKEIIIAFGVASLIITSFIYFQRTTSFHFTDEFNSFTRAYFMLKGKALYSQIFSHHQPMMVYLSVLVQKIMQPTTLYELIVYHRLFVIFFSFLMGIFLLLRFRTVALIFILLFETTKYYLFGNLFLAEAFVVYPLFYFLGLSWEKISGKQIIGFDYLIAGVALWMILLTRLPYAPAGLLLFAYLFLDKKNYKEKILSIGIAISLSLLTIPIESFREYFFAIFTLNTDHYIGNEMSKRGSEGIGILKIFFYPLLTLFYGDWTILRTAVVTLSSFFIAFSVYSMAKLHEYKKPLFASIILGTLAIRYTVPGKEFYEAFYMLPWYAVLISILAFFLSDFYRKGQLPILKISLPILTIIWIGILFHPHSYLLERPNKTELFHQNYGQYYIAGEVIKTLAQPDSTLFVDYWDTLVYWQSGLDSAYHYSMFWPVMENIPRYAQKRTEMFEKYPPDFYYTYCSNKQEKSPYLNPGQTSLYQQLRNSEGRLTCIYIKKNIYSQISEEQWESIKGLGYQK